MGLREQKKLATRQALSWAAIHLAVERGLGNVRVEDIAAAAGVSPRTYNNYFSSKEEAICAMSADRAALVGAALLARPADEPLADALVAAVLPHYTPPRGMDREWVVAARLMMTAPALRGEYLKVNAATKQHLVDAVAQRCGVDPARDMYPGLVAAVVSGALMVGIEHWLHSRTGEEFTAVLESAVRRALAGLA